MSTSGPARASQPPFARFTLADAMILVAATALGLALFRFAYNNDFFTMTIMALAAGGELPPGRVFIDQLNATAWCVLPGFTLAVPILTAIRPRPSRRDAIGGPGCVASVAAILCALPPIAMFVVVKLIRNWSYGFGLLTDNEFLYQHFIPFLNDSIIGVVGASILGGWLALVLVGRWRPKPIWTDRLGCSVGACWVLLSGYDLVYFTVVIPLHKYWSA